MSTGKNIKGALSYNEQKVSEGTADLILAYHFGKDVSEMGFTEKFMRFEKINQLNTKSKTNTLHLSLNFSPEDHLENDTEKLQQIAVDYMERIGFGDQPFLVYQHNDTNHPHLHIVTTTIRPNGKPIYLHNLAKRKSEPVRKAIEVEYNLVQAAGRKQSNHLGSSTKISNIVSRVIAQYRFTNFEDLNAVLQQFNIVADRGKPGTRLFQRKGLVYCQLDANGYKTGKSIKASSIYKSPTLSVLEKKMEQNKVSKLFHQKSVLKKISTTLTQTDSASDVLKQLKGKNIDCIISYDANGSITGARFIDHFTKTVFSNEELGITVPWLEKVKYKGEGRNISYQSLFAQDETNITVSSQLSNNAFSFLKELLSTEQSQPDISPEFMKKKKRKKKRY